MRTARLYGARDIRIESMAPPGEPGDGEALVSVSAVGICGSDLHTYEDGRIGDTVIQSPSVLGHEFSGQVIAVGQNAVDGLHNPLKIGQRVAIEPTVSCWRCEMCEQGHPNLCPNHHFLGLWPYDGALLDQMVVPARNCFPVPDNLSDAAAAMLEPLGVAIHATDLAKLRVAKSVVVLGCGPIGLLIIKMAKLSGADPIYAFDKFPWRVEKAKAWGATEAWIINDTSTDKIAKLTRGRGVDTVIEAAWAGEAVQQATTMATMGGRVVLVGIPGDNKLQMEHSPVRRKGLTLVMTRRMKHTYPRAIHLATTQIDLDDLASDIVPFDSVGAAFEKNLQYAEGVHKIVIEVNPT